MKKYHYACHRCKIEFQSHLDAAHDRVICPCCRQIMMMADITGVEEDTPAVQIIAPPPVEVPPVSTPPVGQPVSASTVEVRPVSSTPLTPPPAVEYVPQPVEPYDNNTAYNQPAPQVEVVEQVAGDDNDEESEDDEPVKKKSAMRYAFFALSGILVGAVVLAAILYFTGNFPTEEYAIGQEEMSAEKKETIAVAGLKEYLENENIHDVSQYFLIDLDGDGQREALANSERDLIVFSGDDGTPSKLFHEEVLSWIWVDKQGLFMVTEDNASTSGEAKWLVKNGLKIDVDITKDIYHFGYGAYYINHEGKDKTLTKAQYYDKLNAVIGKYTRLAPVSFDNDKQ